MRTAVKEVYVLFFTLYFSYQPNILLTENQEVHKCYVAETI